MPTADNAGVRLADDATVHPGRNLRGEMPSTNDRGVSGSVRGEECLGRISGRWSRSSSRRNTNSPKKGGKDNVSSLRAHENFEKE